MGNIDHSLKLKTTVIVPFSGSIGFVGRSEILEKLKDHLSHVRQHEGVTYQARAALFGLGGIGYSKSRCLRQKKLLTDLRKTKIALAFAYLVQEQFPPISIFWILASNTERFHQAFSQIAKSCQISGYSDPRADLLELVKAWLERKDQRPWLMIIDNADDTGFFNSDQVTSQNSETIDRLALENNLGRYIPECSHGSILVTTRNRQTGFGLTKGRGVIEVGQINRVESSQLIHKRLENDAFDPNDVSVLTTRLGNLPLALVQAGAFIQENSLTIMRYLQLLGQSHHAFVELLSQPLDEVGEDSRIAMAVTAT